MADLDSDKNALETYKNLFEAADDDHSNRISYEELVEAASLRESSLRADLEAPHRCLNCCRSVRHCVP